jgi:hypothetical protein
MANTGLITSFQARLEVKVSIRTNSTTDSHSKITRHSHLKITIDSHSKITNKLLTMCENLFVQIPVTYDHPCRSLVTNWGGPAGNTDQSLSTNSRHCRGQLAITASTFNPVGHLINAKANNRPFAVGQF